jgi:ABC-type oligopeptide transport system ATPase subunit
MKQEQELVIALNRADRWLRQQAIQETSRGSANVNSIYLELIERIAQFGQKDSQKSDLSRLRQRIDDLGIQTREFAQYGLATELPSQRFLKALQEIPADRISLVDDIVEPHLDSIQAQLQALRGVHELISGFISSVNSFLSDKELRYTLREGFTILTSDHNPLKPAKLSSGERQLLLLLCNVLVARDSTRLFIIDEPEISLNVKWQRQFLDTLLEITAGTKMQFVVATHSIEMLSSHRESIARLVDQNE